MAVRGGTPPLEHLTVLVADDDLAHRRGVRVALEAHNFSVVGETGDAAAAVTVALRLRPDICLIGLELPNDGLRAIGRIAKSSPETLIVVLSRSDRPQDVVSALTRGASGYLLKGISGERLASTLRAAYEGEPALSRALVPFLIDEIRRGSERRLVLPAGSRNPHATRMGGRRAAVRAALDRGNRGTPRRVTCDRTPTRRTPAPETRR